MQHSNCFCGDLQSSADVTAASANVQKFAIRFKNRCCLLIDGIQGDNNNKNMIVLQLFTAFYNADDLKKWVLQLVNPDLAGSASYTTASNANGDGAATLTYASKIDPYNAGLLRRLQVTSYKLIVARLIIRWWTWQGKWLFKILFPWCKITRFIASQIFECSISQLQAMNAD
jgi:hypothetical protein